MFLVGVVATFNITGSVLRMVKRADLTGAVLLNDRVFQRDHFLSCSYNVDRC